MKLDYNFQGRNALVTRLASGQGPRGGQRGQTIIETKGYVLRQFPSGFLARCPHHNYYATANSTYYRLQPKSYSYFPSSPSFHVKSWGEPPSFPLLVKQYVFATI